jgi:hypothetical protein
MVPFSGAGSEVCGALLAGWEDVQGIELSEDYARLARARISYWNQRKHNTDGGRPVKVRSERKQSPDQMSLFDAA